MQNLRKIWPAVIGLTAASTLMGCDETTARQPREETRVKNLVRDNLPQTSDGQPIHIFRSNSLHPFFGVMLYKHPERGYGFFAYDYDAEDLENGLSERINSWPLYDPVHDGKPEAFSYSFSYQEVFITTITIPMRVDAEDLGEMYLPERGQLFSIFGDDPDFVEFDRVVCETNGFKPEKIVRPAPKPVIVDENAPTIFDQSWWALEEPTN